MDKVEIEILVRAGLIDNEKDLEKLKRLQAQGINIWSKEFLGGYLHGLNTKKGGV